MTDTKHTPGPWTPALIIAAPDLLAALELVLNSLEKYRRRQTRIAFDIAMDANLAEAAARAAIAKAKGE